MSEQKKIRFKDLTVWLKIAIIFGWIEAVLFSIGFIYGFMNVLLK